MRRILRRLRCRLGLHRWQLLYADTGDPAAQYRAEIVCLYCAKVRR